MEFCAIGKAGKYLIKTCDRLYDSVFAQMSETASMFNFIEARLRNMRKSVSDLSDSYVNNYDRITFSEVSLRFIDIAFSELRKRT